MGYNYCYVFIIFIDNRIIIQYNLSLFLYFWVFWIIQEAGIVKFSKVVGWRLYHMEAGINQKNVTNGAGCITIQGERY